MRAKIQENKLRQDLLANQELMEYYMRLRKMIPKHSRELFQRRINWKLLKEVP